VGDCVIVILAILCMDIHQSRESRQPYKEN